MKSIKNMWLVLLTVLSMGFGAALAQNIDFWAAPNPPQANFWRQMAEEYQQVNPDVTITVTPIPETPSSEAAILASLAGGTGPTLSENIFVGFGAQLQNAGAVVSLDTLPGWADLIAAREMETAIQSWTFADGHTYIFPIYTNAMLFGWRNDILNEVGITEVPRTYSEVLDACRAVKETYPDKFLIARADLLSTTWWQRWFDFFMLYDAASGGQPFVEGGEVTADDAAVENVFGFYQDLISNDCVLTQTVEDAFVKGISVWQDLGPWTFSDWSERFPDFALDQNFVLATPPVPDDAAPDAPVYTFADAKGIVIYSQATPEEQQAAWDFVTWVFSDPAHDQEWLNVTNLPPTRGDLTTNETFAEYLSAHPELGPYADEIPYAVPPPANSNVQDLQTTLSEAGFVPAARGDKTPQQAWQDAKAAIEAMIQ